MPENSDQLVHLTAAATTQHGADVQAQRGVHEDEGNNMYLVGLRGTRTPLLERTLAALCALGVSCDTLHLFCH